MRWQCSKTSLVVLLLAHCVVGCHSFQDPLYDARYKRLVIVPFRDRTAPRNFSWYGQSERGRHIVRFLEEWAQSEAAEHEILRGEDADRVVRSIENWPKDRIRPSDWRKILAGVDVDLVLLGEIVEFRHKQPGDLNILRGSAKFDYRLVDAGDGRRAYRSPASREVRYPRQGETDIPISELGVRNPRKVERGIVRAIAERLGKDLFGYYEH